MPIKPQLIDFIQSYRRSEIWLVVMFITGHYTFAVRWINDNEGLATNNVDEPGLDNYVVYQIPSVGVVITDGVRYSFINVDYPTYDQQLKTVRISLADVGHTLTISDLEEMQSQLAKALEVNVGL